MIAAGDLVRRPRRRVAALLMLALAGSLLVGHAAAAESQPAVAAPGDPGTPEAPVVLYVEDFENRPTDSNLLLTSYESAAGGGYTASAFWADRAACNGFIINRTSERTPGDCNGTSDESSGETAFERLTGIPYALGLLAGSADPSQNAAASSYTSGSALAGPNQVQFRTTTPLVLPTANRFVTMSVDAGAMNCYATHPLLRFSLVDEDGQEHPVSASAINPCTDPRARVVEGLMASGVARDVSVGTFAADSAMLLTGGSLGIVLRNESGTTDGNDGAYDNIRVLDVTPQLDKAFSPRSVPAGGVSRLTFTVTNTSDLAAKPGWAATEVLDEGLEVASPANASTTCSGGSVEAAAGGDSIRVEGDLLSGQSSCTLSVDVTTESTPSPGERSSFRNCASNFSELVGLDPPGCADVEFVGAPEVAQWKTVTSSDDHVRAGSQVQYVLHFDNRGETATTVDAIDDLTHVLDDAEVSIEPTSSELEVTREGERIAISGVLEPGHSATVSYTVTVRADGARGDDTMTNLLLRADDAGEQPPADPTCQPEDPSEPDCTVTLIGSYSAVKTVTPDETPVRAGSLLAYTLRFSNSSAMTAQIDETDDLSGVLDDGVVVAGPSTRANGLSVSTITDGSFRVTGSLEPGRSAVVVYVVEVDATGERGDALATNTLLPTNGEVECSPSRCTKTLITRASPATSELHQWKSVEASTTPVLAGTGLTYTLHFVNRGDGPVTVDAVDDLTDVLDDAAVTEEPRSSALVVIRHDERIAVSGVLEAGRSATVSYTMTVRPDGHRGDDMARNTLLANVPGGAPPSADPVCQPTSVDEPECTSTPIGRFATSKAVASSTDPVRIGTVLTYTLTFDNQSTATRHIDMLDDLSDVLDDASILAGPDVSDGALTAERNDDTVVVAGELAPGQTVTVTYRVVIDGGSGRGDGAVDNVLLESGSDPPEACVDTDANCTSTALPGGPVSPDPGDDGGDGDAGGQPEETGVDAAQPLAITGAEIGSGMVALTMVLILGGILAIELSRRRRLLVAPDIPRKGRPPEGGRGHDSAPPGTVGTTCPDHVSSDSIADAIPDP